MRYKIGRIGSLRQTRDIEEAGKAKFWFGRKSMLTMNLNPEANEFRFGTLANFLEMPGR
jgi:hypothetical protein